MGHTFFSPKKISYSGKRGNNLPPWEAVRQERMFPVPHAFVSLGYRSRLERWEQGSSSGFPGARGTLGADSRARGVGAVHAEGPHGLWAQSRGQR